MTDMTTTEDTQSININNTTSNAHQTEKYFAYMIPYTDTKNAIRKLTVSGTYPINRETVISLEEESISQGKSVILCKVSSVPVYRINSENQSGYTGFTTNQSYQLEGNAKSRIFGAGAAATHMHTFEYMYIPIGNSFQFKSNQSIRDLLQDGAINDCKQTLASIGHICSEYPFSQTIGRKFDIYDLTDTEEMCRNIPQTSQLYSFINRFTLQEDMIAQIWNASFAYGASVRTNMSSYTNNSAATLDIMSNSLFDFAFENYDRFANNIANGNLFSRYYGVDAADTINIPVFMGCTPSYRCVVSFYHKNDIPNITFTDIIGNLVARQYKLPAGQFHPEFHNIADRHYFPEDYRNSKPDTDNHIFSLAATVMINSLFADMDYPVLPFQFQIGIKESEETVSSKSRGSVINKVIKTTTLDYKILIEPEFIGRIINKDGSIKQTVKSLAKFINPENSVQLRNIGHSVMESLFDTTEHGAYWPIRDYQEFDSVRTRIKAPLFSYQKRNVGWMNGVESDVNTGRQTMDFKHLGLFEHLLEKQQEINQASIVEFNIGASHYNTVMLRSGTNIPIPKKVKPTVRLSGGVLADDVGLGKTLSIISHLVAQHDRDKTDYLAGQFDCNTLVIIPPRLLKQWIYEIEKYTPAGMFNIIGLASITDVKKFAASKQADFEAAASSVAGSAASSSTAANATTPSVAACDTTSPAPQSPSSSLDGMVINRGPFRVPNALKADYKVLITKLIEESGVMDNISKVTTIHRDGSVSTKNEPVPAKLTTHDGGVESQDSDKPKVIRSAAKKMDIVIMSANLLSNANYREYLVSAFNANGKQAGYDFHTADYVDIFRMKWNRIVVDEAHERIQIETPDNPLDMDTKAVSYSIIHLLQSRYRWAMTATPFEHRYSNLLGYLLWLMPTAKIDINKFSEHRLSELYITSSYAFGHHINDIDIMHINARYLLTQDESLDLQRKIVSKTSKRAVSAEINIPIFTEEVHQIQLGNIEKNIYNNAKTDTNYRGDKLRRLFELCTNICISTEDIQSLGIDPNKIMSLEELNQAMIGNFGKQLDVVLVELADAHKELPLCERKKDLAAKIQTNLRGLEPRLGQRNLSINNQYRNFVESAFSHEDSGGYGGDAYETRDKRVLKKLRKELYSRLLECEAFSEMIIGITIEIMDGFGADRPQWDEYLVLFVIDFMLGTFSTRSDRQQKTIEENIAKLEREKVRLTNQIKLFESNDFIKEKTSDPCSICWTDYTEDSRVAVTHCRHVYCGDCFTAMSTNKTSISCPECRADVIVKSTNITTMRDLLGSNKSVEPAGLAAAETKSEVPEWKTACISKYGTKMATLIEILKELFATGGNRVIIFSQYDLMLKLIGRTLDEYGIKSVYARGNVRVVNKNIDTFKRDESIRVIMLSSEHSNSGSNLTEASHIILVDVLNMSADQTKQVETQAIGRAVRLGQRKPVKVVRLITQETIESETYAKNKYDIKSIQ
jgi:SNF2 family DNA or RNA helicase